MYRISILMLAVLIFAGCGDKKEEPAPKENETVVKTPESKEKHTPTAPGTKEFTSVTDGITYENEVKVSNVDELFKAIASNTKIILAPGTYNITREPVHEKDIYRPTLELHNLINLAFVAPEGAEMITDDEVAPVLTLRHIDNFVIEGITLGHTTEAVCGAPVISINAAANNISINNCDLYGCGEIGLNAFNSENIKVTNTVIRDCSMQLVMMRNVHQVTFENCEFSGGPVSFTAVEIEDASSKVSFINCVFKDIKVMDERTPLVIIGMDESSILFEGCTITNNTAKEFLTNDTRVEMKDNKFSDNDFFVK